MSCHRISTMLGYKMIKQLFLLICIIPLIILGFPSKVAPVEQPKVERIEKASRDTIRVPLQEVHLGRSHITEAIPPPPPAAPEPIKIVKPTPKVAVKSHAAPGGIAACIRKYESGGNYQAQNPSSSASGAYQFIDSTWRSLTGRSDRAKDAPPSVQDAAFYKLWANGAGARHWTVAPKCGY